VRTSEAGQAIAGCVVAHENALVKQATRRYMVQAIVFDTAEAADQAMEIEADWMQPSTDRLHTAQFQQDNVIALIGAGPTEQRVRDLRAAMEDLATG
jgi:hypothetical protein